MKMTIALVAALMSSTLLAKTTVTLPFYVEVNNKLVKTSVINKKYNLKGAEKIVESIIVENTSTSLKKARDTFWAENGKVDDLTTKYNADFWLALVTPGHAECFSGDASEAVDILGGLTDGPFSDQMGFWGWKYKNETHFDESGDAEEMNNALNKRSPLWKNWDVTSDSILIITHQSDSGDDVINSVVKACK